MNELTTTDKAEAARILKGCGESVERMSLTFFPESFFRPFSAPHHEIFRVLDDDRIQMAQILAPRGIGKTSIMRSFLAQQVLFGLRRYVLYVSASGKFAINLTEGFKRQVMDNPLILKCFGNQESDMWSEERWKTKGGLGRPPCMVMPRGAGQQMRGALFGSARPDLIIVDDLEDETTVATEEQRKKLKTWFWSTVANCVDRGSHDWRIIVIGTMLHADALVADLLDDEDWQSVPLSICDDNYRTLWPEFIGQETLDKLVASFRRKGLLDVFAREFQNIPMSSEEGTFTHEMFHQYTFDDLKKTSLVHYLLCDPAKTHEEYSCDTAVICIGHDIRTGNIYVREVALGQMAPDEIYQVIERMARRYRAHTLGIEVTSLDEFITHPLKDYLLRHNCMLQVVDLKARGRKEDRIKSLRPYYAEGRIFHNAGCGALETQLLGFPHGKRLDAIDALAYLTELLYLGGLYAGVSMSEAETQVHLNKIYKELEDNCPEPIEEWRVA